MAQASTEIDHQIMRWERVQVSESCSLARKRWSEWEHGEKSVYSPVKEDKFQGGEEGQAKRTSLEEVEESMSR